MGVGEREFLVSPVLGSVTMTAAGYIQPADSRVVNTKKLFDWMSDEQHANLQILAIHYEWFAVSATCTFTGRGTMNPTAVDWTTQIQVSSSSARVL